MARVEGRKAILTGASGLLGRHLLPELIEKGIYVYAVSRSRPAVSSGGWEFLPLDLSERGFSTHLPGDASVVVHLAQSLGYREFPESASDLIQVNVSATGELLVHALSTDVEHFVFTSTGGLYRKGGGILHENSPINTLGELDPYLGSKLCGEILVQTFRDLFETTVVRPFFIYGPAQRRSMFLPRIFDNVKKGSPIFLNGDEGLRVNPIHVVDAARALAASLTTPRSVVVNLGGPEILSIREIAEKFGSFLGVAPNFEVLEEIQSDLVADIALMKDLMAAPVRRLSDYLSDIASLD